MSQRHTIDELQDYQGNLEDLHRIVTELLHTHGPTATVEFDAGHNNVSVIVTSWDTNDKRRPS